MKLLFENFRTFLSESDTNKFRVLSLQEFKDLISLISILTSPGGNHDQAMLIATSLGLQDALAEWIVFGEWGYKGRWIDELNDAVETSSELDDDSKDELYEEMGDKMIPKHWHIRDILVKTGNQELIKNILNMAEESTDRPERIRAHLPSLLLNDNTREDNLKKLTRLTYLFLTQDKNKNYVNYLSHMLPAHPNAPESVDSLEYETHKWGETFPFDKEKGKRVISPGWAEWAEIKL